MTLTTTARPAEAAAPAPGCGCTDFEPRPIPGMPGYRITRHGTVYGKRGKELTPFRDRDGYHWVGLCTNPDKPRRTYTHRVQRLVLLAFVGPPPTPAHEGAHLDGQRRNNCVINLAWKTRAENEADKIRHGTLRRGPAHPRWGLSVALREEIRRTYRPRRRGGLTQKQLAAAYGIGDRHLRRILARQDASAAVPPCPKCGRVYPCICPPS